MFSQLPQECVFIIIDYLLEETPVKSSGFYNGSFVKEWNKKPVRRPDRTLSEMRRFGVIWKRPPFTHILPLISVSHETNETFDTNEVWTYLYEKEFRKSVAYKRKPKNSKKMMLDKSNGIIRDRYQPLYEFGKTSTSLTLQKIKDIMKQIHILDTALSQIKPQIVNASKIEDDVFMDALPIILNGLVKVPIGYKDTYGHIWESSTNISLEKATSDRTIFWRTGKRLIENKKQMKQIIEKLEKILGNIS